MSLSTTIVLIMGTSGLLVAAWLAYHIYLLGKESKELDQANASLKSFRNRESVNDQSRKMSLADIRRDNAEWMRDDEPSGM